MDVRPACGGNGPEIHEEPSESWGLHVSAAFPLSQYAGDACDWDADFWDDFLKQEASAPVSHPKEHCAGHGVDVSGGVHPGGDGHVRDHIRSSKESVQDDRSIEHPRQPALPDRHRQASTEAAPGTPRQGIRPRVELLDYDDLIPAHLKAGAVSEPAELPVVTIADDFHGLMSLAVKVVRNALTTDISTYDKASLAAAKFQVDTALRQLSIAARVDENAVRRTEVSILPRLLARIAEEKEKMGQVGLHGIL